MKKTGYILLICLGLGICSCKSDKKSGETPTRGIATVLVDETFFPMVEGQVRVFESQYKYARLNIVMQPEQDITRELMLDSSRIAILSRDLTAEEQAYFENKRLVPQITAIAYDAIALIVNKNHKDSVISETDLWKLFTGNDNPHNYSLVFGNSKSSTVQYMKNYAGVESFANSYIHSVSSNKELITYIAGHENTIGFIGVDWLYEYDEDQQPYIDKIKVLAVENIKPTQQNIALGTYPFIRKIRIINCQGTAGLGLGFASFLAGDVGQRIILKAGLVPVIYPKREIQLRNKL